MHQLDLLLFPNITCKEHKKPADVDNKATALHSNMCILTIYMQVFYFLLNFSWFLFIKRPLSYLPKQIV